MLKSKLHLNQGTGAYGKPGNPESGNGTGTGIRFRIPVPVPFPDSGFPGFPYAQGTVI